MALELYWGSGSPFVWRVMLTLEAKQLPYESKQLEFSKAEHKSAEYLALNPRGKVPTLRDGDFTLYESVAIMAYLERKVPQPPLFGNTPVEAGLIWRFVAECEYLIAAGDKIIRPLFFGKGLENVEQIQAGAEGIRNELQRLDAALSEGDWLVGDRMTAADIAVFPLVQLCLRAAGKDAARSFDLRIAPLKKFYSNVAQWVQRIEALPYYQNTYPPHWRTSS